MRNALTPSFFKEILPELSVGVAPSADSLPGAIVAEDRARFLKDGFCPVADNAGVSEAECDRLAKGIEVLHSKGLPASFIFVYDEAFDICQRIAAVVGLPPIYDVLAWRVTGSGFAPHRDRQPDDVAASFSADGFPKYVTCWIALSDVDSDSSSLFVVPAHVDPGYLDASVDEGDPLHATFCSAGKHQWQHIRSFQGHAKSWIFSHRLMHWGSANLSDRPRISISFVCADPTFEGAYLKASSSEQPEVRIALIAAQCIVYYQRESYTVETLLWFWNHFSPLKEHFAQEYVLEVTSKLVAALQEQPQLDDDAEELLLELTLEMEPCMAMEDDFDEMEMEIERKRQKKSE